MNTFIDQLTTQALAKVGELGGRKLPLPDGLDLIEGEFKGDKVSMQSYAWRTESFRLLRFTGLQAGERLHTFNFVIYPQHYFDAPLFASDWVVGAEKLRIAVMDAMPLFPDETEYEKKWVTPFDTLYQESLELAPAFERKLSWSTRFLGKYACLATDVAATELSGLVTLWGGYLDKYLALFDGQAQKVDAVREAHVGDWHKSYNAAHLAVENTRNPYMLYFGKEIGTRYNEEFLFSDSFGG